VMATCGKECKDLPHRATLFIGIVKHTYYRTLTVQSAFPGHPILQKPKKRKGKRSSRPNLKSAQVAPNLNLHRTEKTIMTTRLLKPKPLPIGWSIVGVTLFRFGKQTQWTDQKQSFGSRGFVNRVIEGRGYAFSIA
jgi:hypothetical protein